MNIKVIKTEKEYEKALLRIEKLMREETGGSSEEELELLSLLVEKFEDEHYELGLSTPVEAIKFRMEQEGLKRKDLIPYIGSQSKVSEILSGKRDLSLNMIRALHEGLGIPVEVLIQKSNYKLNNCKYNLSDYPFTEMFNKGYFSNTYSKLNEAKEYAEECLDQFFSIFNKINPQLYCRQTDNKLGDIQVIYAWQSQILNLVNEEKIPIFKRSNLNDIFINRIVKLSYFTDGVKLIKEALNEIGIHFIILEHLPKTYLDGGCFFSQKGNPVIAMTLRYDRLDNFWFTLLHELGHLMKGHLKKNDKKLFVDDTISEHESNKVEDEADDFAQNAFIPYEKWLENKERVGKSVNHLIKFARELEISPAIVAGRYRWETKNHRKYSNYIGQGKVKKRLITSKN